VTNATLQLIAFLLAGILLGAGYYGLLFVEVGQYVHGASARYAIATHILRLAAAGVTFWLIAQYGAAPLLASLTGFTLVLAMLKPFTAAP
jgi:hypothetical protein